MLISLNKLLRSPIALSIKRLIDSFDNFILLRQDKTPTYMLSVVVDDHDMNVNTVIRGNDHMSNTFRQAQIYKQLKWK